MTPALRTILFGQRPLWTPAALGSAAPYWFDFGDAATVTVATGVSSITNKGALGGTATQATGANQPTYTASALNGLSIASFDGSNDTLLTGVSSTTPTTSTIAVVMKRRLTGNYDCVVAYGLFGAGGTGMMITGLAANDWQANDIIATGNGTDAGQTARSVVQTPSVTSDTAWHGVRMKFGATNATYQDGNLQTLRVTNPGAYAAVSGQAFYLGSLNNSGSFARCDIAELVFLNAVVTAADEDRLDGYLAWRWGLQVNLPSTHPYKNTPPRL